MFRQSGVVRSFEVADPILYVFESHVLYSRDLQFFYYVFASYFIQPCVSTIVFFHGLGRLTCSGIDALPSFPGASTISSSSRFVVEGVFRQSGVLHSFMVVDPVLFVFVSHVLYSRDL